MPFLLQVSLLLNVAVLVPVCAGLIFDRPWVAIAYGPKSAARGILLSIYLAIAVGSLALVFRGNADMAACLLSLQVLYKITTPISTRAPRNPVVVSNLAIALFHVVSLVTSYRPTS